MVRRWVRENGTLRHNEFIPPASGELSVTRHLEATADEIWDEGREVARLRAKSLLGRVDLRASDCRNIGLRVIKTPKAPAPLSDPEPRRILANPNHADLVFPSLPKADQIAIAQALVADGLRVVSAPAGSPDTASAGE